VSQHDIPGEREERDGRDSRSPGRRRDHEAEQLRVDGAEAVQHRLLRGFKTQSRGCVVVFVHEPTESVTALDFFVACQRICAC
jgi:hypothetical protein